ncbi:MAG: DUF3857 domain-containing protein [Candidatus Riflebacteria bacterium]|nr:DUF3857 domain-containing protein [Candidatus Riflebacteria bacterium]
MINRLVRQFALCFLFLFAMNSFLAADVVYLNEGEEHTGKVTEINASSVTIIEPDGDKAEFEKSKVAHVLFSKIRSGDENSYIASITDPFLTEILKKAPVSNDYPDSDFVTLCQKYVTIFNPDDTIEHENRTLYKVLKEPGLELANQSVYFAKDRERLELNFAHTYNSDGKIYHLTDDALSEEDIFHATPEYDRLKMLKFALKKVDLGSIIDVSYTFFSRGSSILRPFRLNAYFGQREPILSHIFEVNSPASMPLQVLQLNWTASNTPAYSEIASGSNIIRKWEFADPKGYIPEQNMISTSRLFPRIIVAQKNDWQTISKTFMESLNNSAPSEKLLDAFIESSGAASKTSLVMKSAAIYEAIQRKIRDLGISCFDYDGYDCPSAEIVLKKNYGSQFARCILFYHALRRIGIPAEFGFVSAWRSGGIEEKVSCLGQASNALVKIITDSTPVYTLLDNDYLPLGQIPTWAQGSKAVIFNEKGFAWDILPDGGLEKNRNEQTVFVKILNDGTMEVKDTRKFCGPSEPGMRYMRVAKDIEKRMFAEKTVKGVNPKAVLTDYVLSDMNDFAAPVVFTLTYKIRDAVQKPSGDLMAFRNYWVNNSGASASLASRTFPMDVSSVYSTSKTIFFELPDGFQWVDWKRKFNYTGSFISFASNMSQKGSMLLYSDDYKIWKKELDLISGYPQYRECVSIMTDLSNQWLVLEKTK